jgi:hypothetical protein
MARKVCADHCTGRAHMARPSLSRPRSRDAQTRVPQPNDPRSHATSTAYLTKRLHERDLGRGVAAAQFTLNNISIDGSTQPPNPGCERKATKITMACCGDTSGHVSIHARARRATCESCALQCARGFQSTPARGGRLVWSCDEPVKTKVSIHARARRATALSTREQVCSVFQSTPARGGRRELEAMVLDDSEFQSTPARGGRREQSLALAGTS